MYIYIYTYIMSDSSEKYLISAILSYSPINPFVLLVLQHILSIPFYY